MAVDQTNDTGYATLRVLVQRYPVLREMSKTAELDPQMLAQLPDSSFAWPGERKFPIHTREHAALSYAYSKVAAEQLPTDVVSFLSKACDMYGVDTNAFVPAVQEKVASTEFWLLSEKKRFRVAAPEDVKVAETVLHEKYAQLSINERAEAFMQLHKAAQHYGVTLSTASEKLAGYTITSTQVLKDWVEARQEAATKMGSVLADAYAKLAQSYTGVKPFIVDRGDQLKLASLLIDLDKQSGIDQLYGKKMLDPLRTVFNTDKLASDAMDIGGVTFSINKLAQIPATFWSDALGDDIMREIAPDGNVKVSALRAILPTLPQDLKVTVGRQLSAYR